MPDLVSYRDLLYQYEILRARLEIRDHLLKTIISETYDNVGQMLSLLRIQLSLLQEELVTGNQKKIDSCGKLVERITCDLRSMCNLFFPETKFSSKQVFMQAVLEEIKGLYPQAFCRIDEKRKDTHEFETQNAWIFFAILLETISLVSKSPRGEINSAYIKDIHGQLSIAIYCKGEIPLRQKTNSSVGPFDFSIFNRIKLIGGCFKIKKTVTGDRIIKLVMPIN